MTSATLLNLYSSILVPIYSEWVGVSSLCLLDSAICSSMIREQFLSLLALCSQYYNGNEENLDWFTLRRLRVRCFESSACGLTEAEKQLLSRTKYMESLRISYIKTLKDVLKICNEIHKIRFCAQTRNSIVGIMSVLPKVVGLKCLRVSHAKYFDAGTQYPDMCLPSLTEIELDDDASLLVEQCTSLESANIPFSNSIITSLSKVEALKSLRLKTRIREYITDHAILPLLSSSLVALTHFSVGNTELSDIFVIPLVQYCPQLVHFDMASSHITNAALIALSHCKQLRYFCISSPDISDSGIMVLIDGCPLLTTLMLNNCRQLTDLSVLCALVHCRRLGTLAISGVKISDAVLDQAFVVSPTIEYLDMRNCFHQVNRKAVVSNIVDMSSIQIEYSKCLLRRPGCMNNIQLLTTCIHHLNSDDFLQIAKQCPRLTKLILSHDTGFNDECVTYIIKYCPLLTSVAIRNGVSASSIRAMVTAYPTLCDLKYIRLKLYDCRSLFSSPMTHLRRLVLSCCRISSNSVALHCPKLREFQLSNDSFITSDELIGLLTQCKLLQTIRILNCTQVRAIFLESIAELDRPLKELLVIGSCFTQEVKKIMLPLLTPLVQKVIIQTT